VLQRGDPTGTGSGAPAPPQPDEVGVGLVAGWVAPDGCEVRGEPGGLDVGECADPTGWGDVGEAVGRDGDGLADVGEGLGRGVVRDGVGVAVGVGGGDPVEPSEEVDPVVVGTGRTST
jgi:hypothetical protein